MVEGQEAGGCVAPITVTAHHTVSQVSEEEQEQVYNRSRSRGRRWLRGRRQGAVLHPSLSQLTTESLRYLSRSRYRGGAGAGAGDG